MTIIDNVVPTEVTPDIEDLIDQGSIITKNIFLPNFNTLTGKIFTYDWLPTFQPKPAFYGDRMQAYPVWETKQISKIDPDNYTIILLEFQKLFKRKIINFSCFLRKTITEELKQSAHLKDTRFGFVHIDGTKFGAVVHFEHSINGGTAFFENCWEKKPNIEYGAFPNRLTLFSGPRCHAACHDEIYKQRHVLCAFFDTEK